MQRQIILNDKEIRDAIVLYAAKHDLKAEPNKIAISQNLVQQIPGMPQSINQPPTFSATVILLE